MDRMKYRERKRYQIALALPIQDRRSYYSFMTMDFSSYYVNISHYDFAVKISLHRIRWIHWIHWI